MSTSKLEPVSCYCGTVRSLGEIVIHANAVGGMVHTATECFTIRDLSYTRTWHSEVVGSVEDPPARSYSAVDPSEQLRRTVDAPLARLRGMAGGAR